MLQNNYINNSYRKSEFCAFTISLSSFMYSKIKGTLNYSLCTMLGSQNPVQCSLDNLRFLLQLFQGNHCVKCLCYVYVMLNVMFKCYVWMFWFAHQEDWTFPSISYYFHIPKIFLNFFPHTGKNRNRQKSNLLP